jgi:predicted Zn-dependent peptidase
MSKIDPYKFKKIVLENGLTIFYSKIPYATKTVIYSAMGVGAIHGKRGCSHFLEHFLIEETEKFKNPKEVDIFLENNGGKQLDLFTNYYKTVFALQINSKFFSEGLVPIEELFFKPKLTEKNFEREKKVILEEINTRIPRKKIVEHYDKRIKMLYDIEKYPFEYKLFHPYVTIGSPEEIQNLSLNDIKNHYEKFYASNNLSLFIGTDLSEKEVVNKVKKVFGKYKSKKIIFPKNKINKNQKPKVDKLIWTDEEVYERKINNSSVEISTTFVGNFKRVYGFAKELLQEILFNLVREQNGLSYNPYAKVEPNKWITSLDVGFETGDKNYIENINKPKEIIFEAIEKAIKSKDIFERIKRNELRTLSYNESVITIVYTAMYDYFVYGKVNNLTDDKKEIEKVEFKDVVKILKKLKNDFLFEIVKSTT